MENTIQFILKNHILSVEQFKIDLVSDLFPEMEALKSYPNDYVKAFIFDKLNETFLRKNALELFFFRNAVDNITIYALLLKKKILV